MIKNKKNLNVLKRSAAKIFAAALILFLCQNAHATYDPEYIKNFRHKLALKTFLSKSLTVLKYTDASSNEYIYYPNTPLSFGAGISWGGIALAGSSGLDFLKNKDRGDTEFVDLQGYYYKRKLVLSFFLQNYKGVYHDNNGDYILRPDIEMIRMCGYAEYVFNGNKFSYSSSFSQKEKQLKSAGSFLAGAGIYYDRIKSEKSFIPKSAVPDRQKISNVQFGPSVGYAYNFLIKKHFFISTSFSVGANFLYCIVNSERAAVEVRPIIIPKAAIGYSRENWGINLTFVNNEVSIMSHDSRKMNLSSGKFMLTYSSRFNFNPKISAKYRRIFFKNPGGEQIIENVPVKP